jgi:hypothetical protein
VSFDLIFIGSGPERKKVKELAETSPHNIVFTSFQALVILTNLIIYTIVYFQYTLVKERVLAYLY